MFIAIIGIYLNDIKKIITFKTALINPFHYKYNFFQTILLPKYFYSKLKKAYVCKLFDSLLK
jgi:hypothetical protein